MTSGIPQGSILGTVLLNTFTSDSGIECAASKFEDDMKLSGAIDTPERWEAIQNLGQAGAVGPCKPHEV